MESSMSAPRLEAAEAIRRRVQGRANEAKLGVSIVFVGLQDIHPPLGNKQIQVAAAFEQVFSAKQQKQTNILYWQAYAARTIPAPGTEATPIISEGRNGDVNKVNLPEGE